jgi:prepilin-type N-terminal cleavage/methylation domain-containing protein
MHPGKQYRRRRGLTLVELIVVITIILLVAALGAAFMPRVQERQHITRGTDLLSQWLLMAKQRARRDSLVTGLRFQTDPNDPNAGSYPNQYTQAVYIQQPPAFTGGTCTSVTANADGTYTANFLNVDFSNGGMPVNEWLVQAGDFFLLSNPPVNFVLGVPSATSLTLFSGAASTTVTPNYRVIRQPRVLTGEPVLQLPGTVTVDLNVSRPALQTQILFAPNGSVTGQGVGGGKIVFWVKDPTSVDPSLGGLVAIQTQTGFISTYDIGPLGNEFMLVDAGRDEGF